MSARHSRHERPAWRPLAAAVAGGAVLIATGFGVWASLDATASNTTAQHVTSGTLKLQLSDNGDGFTQAVSNLAPGDVVNRYVDLANNGSLDAKGMTLGIVASPNNALVTDGSSPSTTKALHVTVTQCTGGTWAPSTGVCSGTTSSALSSTVLSTLSTPQSLTGLTTIGNGTTIHLQVTLTLPDQTETTTNGTLPTNTIQGLSTDLTYTFTEGQRDATTTTS
ncbi:MAG TPA: TasA family protein [Mycobacteriales bacterium]|nr:TasA family protein [Mycobacteriales bacterium]